MMTEQELSKEVAVMRHFLLGAPYLQALKAMNFAIKVHTGKRKDGSPEFSHQMAIGHYLRTLPIPKDMVDVSLALAFMHDVIEDYPHLRTPDLKEGGDSTIIELADVLNKNGLTEAQYMERLADCWSCTPALVKGADRIHNLSTAPSGFKPEKVVSYIKETEEHILPMLKVVQRKFADVDAAFENERMVLKMLCKALVRPESK